MEDDEDELDGGGGGVERDGDVDVERDVAGWKDVDAVDGR